MKETTLKNILLTEIENTQGWISKGQLFLLSEQNGFSPENGGRRLRELESEGKIQVSYYQGKKGQRLARYAKIGEEKPQKVKVVLREISGEIVAVIV